MKKLSPVHLVLGLLAAFGIAAASAATAQDIDKIQIQAVKITDQLYVLAGAGGNVAVFKGPDGGLLIDDGVRQLGEKVRAAVAALQPGPVRFVLNTNWHYDHADNNGLWAKDGALVIGHAKGRKRMSAEQRIPELDPSYLQPPYPEAALPRLTVDRGFTLHFNGEEILAEHDPAAHSEGDLVYRFVKADVIHTGDIFFSNGFPFLHVSGGGTIDGMIAAVDRILTLIGDKTVVIPGHGPVSDKKGLAEYRNLLTVCRTRIGELLKAGKTVEEIRKADPLKDLQKASFEAVPSAEFAKLVAMDLAARAKK